MNKEDFNKIKDLINRSDSVPKKIIEDFEKQLAEVYQNLLIEIQDLIKKESNYPNSNHLKRLKFFEENIFNEINKHSIDYQKKVEQEDYSIDLSFINFDSRIVEVALLNPMYDRWLDELKTENEDMLREIKDSLILGLIRGIGYSQIAANFSAKSGFDYDKAVKIMHTEGHRIQNLVGLLGENKVQASSNRLGMVMEKVWSTAKDNRVRESHQYMEGQVADENDLFHFRDGTPTLAPGLSGKPEFDDECRCVTIQKLVFDENGDPTPETVAALLKNDYSDPNQVLTFQVNFVNIDRKSTRLNSSHIPLSRMPSSA